MATEAPADPGYAWRFGLARLLGAAALVALTAWLGLELAREDGRVTAIWPANAVLLVLLVRVPARDRIGMLGAGFLGYLGVNLAVGEGWAMAPALAFVNVFEVAAALMLSVRWLGRHVDLTRGRALAGFYLSAGLAAPALASTLAAAVLWIGFGAPYGAAWRMWFMADALGMMVVAPLLLVVRSRDLIALFRGRALRETAVAMAILGLVVAVVFGQERYPLLFPIFPVLLFAAIRLGFAGAVLGCFLTTAITLAFTLAGHGPLGPIAGPSLADRVLVLQAFLAVCVLTALPVAAILAQRDRLQRRQQAHLAELTESHAQLEQQSTQLAAVSERLLASDAVFRGAFDNTTDCLLIVGVSEDRGYVLETMNRTAELILGMSARAAVGKSIEVVLPPGSMAQMEPRLANCITAGMPLRFDGAELLAEGRHWEVILVPLLEPGSEKVVRIVATLRDVTQRRRHEEVLQRTNALKQAMLEATDYAIIATTAEGTITVFNRGAERMLGYGAPEMIGQCSLERLHDSREMAARAGVLSRDLGRPIEPGFGALVARPMEGTLEEREWTFIRKDGSRVPVLLSISALRSKTGDIFGFVGIAKDITEQKRVERALNAARKTAEAGARAKAEFLAAMSHELRTPMTGMLGMIELLRTDPPAAERRRFLDTLHGSAQGLMALLGDVLDFSKIEAGRLTLEAVDFEVGEALGGVVSLFRDQASAKGLTLTLHCDDEAARQVVRSDPTRLRQVLGNLVGNAIKFTPAGRIAVTVAAPPASDAGRPWRFEVRDTGIGIDELGRARLFKAFSQADASTTRRFGGTGLGLAICKRIVGAMGGEIGVESAPGEGSVFWFELPLPAGEAPRVAPQSAAAEPLRPSERRLRVLVAEDNSVNQLLIGTILERMGHEAVCVETGLQAIAAVRDQAFDLVLMDMQMPEMDGPTATRHIRALDGEKGRLPVIALTADAVPEHRHLFESAGLDGFLSKPIVFAKLRECLDGIIQADSASAGAKESQAGDADAQAAAADPSASDLDEDRVRQLWDRLGPDTLAELLDAFLADAASRLARLGEAVAADDRMAIRQTAHALKGAAASVGATRLAAAARVMESITPDSQPGAIYDETEAAAAAACAAVQAWRARMAPSAALAAAGG